MTERYEPREIEQRWQRVWDDAGAFHTPNPEPGEIETAKTYVVEMLPYPSGELHMGHVLNYTIGDVVARLRRRRGYRVLRPMGYDAFGLPAENAAIRDGVHPRISTERNIAASRAGMHRMGWAMDWEREISTADPAPARQRKWRRLAIPLARLCSNGTNGASSVAREANAAAPRELPLGLSHERLFCTRRSQ